MSSGRAILDMNGVSFSYGESPLIEALSLSTGEAEFIGLLGANGSGKSTMLKLLGGILKPKKGGVLLWGRPINSLRNRDRAKLVSYLPQSLDMGVPFRVGELASMGAYPYDFSPPMSVDEALGMVGLKGKKGLRVSSLSGGEKRRAYIAMTLLQGAGILLLDEPLANLDVRYQLEIIRLLKRLNEEKKITVVMALHDINLAMRFGRLLLVKSGAMLKDGPPEEVLTEGLLREAFEIEARIKKDGGHSYISYE